MWITIRIIFWRPHFQGKARAARSVFVISSPRRPSLQCLWNPLPLLLMLLLPTTASPPFINIISLQPVWFANHRERERATSTVLGDKKDISLQTINHVSRTIWRELVQCHCSSSSWMTEIITLAIIVDTLSLTEECRCSFRFRLPYSSPQPTDKVMARCQSIVTPSSSPTTPPSHRHNSSTSSNEDEFSEWMIIKRRRVNTVVPVE